MEESQIKEHILVCLSSSPSNPKVINTASKMAKVFNADFTALFIETSEVKNISEENKKRLEQNINLAKQNGARIVTLNGDDIAYQVSHYSKTSKVSKIVIGRSGYKSNRFFSPPNFVDKLIELNPDIEIYVIPDKVQKIYLGQNHIKIHINFPKLSFKDTVKSCVILFFATIIGFIFHKFYIDESNIIMVYIFGVMLTSYITDGMIYGLISSFFSVLIFNFFFTEPYFSFISTSAGNPITFLIMFLVALFISSITEKIKAQASQSYLKAYSMEIMLEMSQKLQKCSNIDEITKTTDEQIKKLLSCDVVVYKVLENNKLEESVRKNDGKFELNIIKWVIKNKKQAGITTDIFKESKYFYLPIHNLKTVFGVVRILKETISEFEKNLLIAMLRESALAYEKETITQSKNELLLRHKQEELRSTLLRTISHDLRTPFTGISGNADILIKNSSKINEDKKQQIYIDIYDDSIWLLNLVENLLSITRFGKQEITIKKESEFISDIVAESISHLGRKKENFNIKTLIEDDNLSAKMDSRLICQVIFNMIDNAMKYSSDGSIITVSAKKCGKYIEVSVTDEGRGISEENKKRVFDMFYTVNNSVADGRRGLGIGLALCKSIILAHGGEISVKDNIPKGTIFSFNLVGDFYE